MKESEIVWVVRKSEWVSVQGYLALEKTRPPQDLHRALGIGLL